MRKIFDKKNSLKVKGLSIDTRSIKKDNLFLAIKGKNSDGSKFIKDALKKGAGGVITSSKIRKKNKKIIETKNTISFLNSHAKLKREYSLAQIIAVTGRQEKHL